MARDAFKATPADHRNMVTLPPSADDLPDRVSVDLDGDDKDNFEIVVKDDTPRADRGKPTRLTGKSLADEEDELRGVSADVQKRIDRIRFETHTERRGKEQAERERDAAALLARETMAEVERLRKITEAGTTELAKSMRGEREARLTDAQRRLSLAHAEGNSDEVAKATRDMTAAQAELTQITAAQPAPRQQQAPQQQPPPARQQPQISPVVAKWIAKNDSWWGKDRAKTDAALGFDRVVQARGFRDDTPEYAQEVDRLMQTVYPDHEPLDDEGSGYSDDGGGSSPRRTNSVERGGREGGTTAPPLNGNRVELTQSEVSLAKRMRIPLQTYAAEKKRRMQNEKGGA